jgi:hypothetical protein
MSWNDTFLMQMHKELRLLSYINKAYSTRCGSGCIVLGAVKCWWLAYGLFNGTTLTGGIVELFKNELCERK